MPIIYLSPSTEENHVFINGGTEEQYMNLIVDYMEPYLISSGVKIVRNTPQMSSSSSIFASNSGNYDFHLAIHSHAAPETVAGQLHGTNVYYYPESEKGQQAADIIAQNFKYIYPDPSLVKAIPTTTIEEVSKTRAPSVLIDIAFYDNADDANWIKNNIRDIAKNLAYSVTEILNVPFIDPQPQYTGTVKVDSGTLDIRSRPCDTGNVLTQAFPGDPITILGNYDGWYVVDYNGTVGYALSQYILV